MSLPEDAGLTSMSVSDREWLTWFLGQRRLEAPDGRPLYAYRCTQSEFADVVDRLGIAVRDGRLTRWAVRAFVLYASEWWQRHYDGGRWAWEPLLRYVGWGGVHFPDLYGPVREALSWWQVELVRLETSTRYLGTFACQGGLPLALVGEASRVTSYLRAVLQHAGRYRQFVDDPIELARDQQHLLRPPTLRREYVFRLAADLVDAVLDLRKDVQGEDVLEALDERRPGWRESMPLDLDSERARELLVGLLRDAKTGVSTGSIFSAERFLSRTAAGWRLGARMQMPRSVTREGMALHLGVSESELPLRMHVRTMGQGSRVVGLYAAGGEEFHLVSGERNRAAAFWDEDAAGEFRLEFFAQDVVGVVVVRRGGAMGELPWAFRDEDGECAFIGEGSVSDRSPELLVALPDGCEASRGQALDANVVGRCLWRVSEPAVIETNSGTCSVKPSSEQMLEEDYRLSGERFYGFRSAYPLFRGEARLIVARAEERHRAVSAVEVSWRGDRENWRARPDGFGLWEVRHVREGVLRHHDRVGLLPASLSLFVRPGSDLAEGELVLDHAKGAGVADDGSESRLIVSPTLSGVRMQVSAVDRLAPPAEVALRLRWPAARELRVRAPFPGEGGRFLKNDRPLGRTLPVDDIYGVRATALSTDELQRFWIEGELKAADALSLRKVAYFRHSLRKSGIRHELALIEVDAMLRLLLGASAASDARIVLRIVDRHQVEHGAVEVKRFAGGLEHDPSMGSVSVTSPLEEDGVQVFEALPLARTDLEPVILPTVGPVSTPVCAILPESLRLEDEPWVVVLRQDGGVRTEPVVVGGRRMPWPTTRERMSLREALRLADAAHRAEKVEESLFEMLDGQDAGRLEEDWSFLTDMMLCLEGVPPTIADLLSTLPRCPKMLVRCLFRLDPSLRRRIWRLDNELPFSWLLITRKIWREEAEIAYTELCAELAGVDDAGRFASERVLSVLDEGAERVGALDTVSTDVRVALAGGALSEAFETAVREERDRKTQDHVNLLVSLDDWPAGDGRREWEEELERGEFLSKLGMWQFESEHRARQPTFDTPVAGAWCCFFSKPTPRTIFLVKRLRAHAPDWFDMAYRAAWFRLALLEDRLNRDQE